MNLDLLTRLERCLKLGDHEFDRFSCVITKDHTWLNQYRENTKASKEGQESLGGFSHSAFQKFSHNSPQKPGLSCYVDGKQLRLNAIQFH